MLSWPDNVMYTQIFDHPISVFHLFYELSQLKVWRRLSLLRKYTFVAPIFHFNCFKFCLVVLYKITQLKELNNYIHINILKPSLNAIAYLPDLRPSLVLAQTMIYTKNHFAFITLCSQIRLGAESQSWYTDVEHSAASAPFFLRY